MPKELTIDTGFDALSHALECFISLWKNEFSNALALKSVELIFKYLPVAVKNGKDKEARNFLHQAATMAGLAFGNANVHIAHTMGHCLGAVFHIPHGRSVGIMLKYVTQYCLNNPNEQDESIKIYAKVAKQLGWAKWEESDRTAALKVIEKVTELQNELNFPLTLQDLGISKTDLESNLDTLVNLCFQDASGSMCPRLPMKEDFENIYRYARQGKDIDF
jgi:alcohol dehydrogenase class IV